MVYARWVYSRAKWEAIMKKLLHKTRQEELYAAVWFPVLFGIVFFKFWYIGALVGVVVGWLYLRFRVFFVAQKFALPAGRPQAEVIIGDAYLRVNGNFLHYADGHYYLRSLALETDAAMGPILHFTIGWQTRKGFQAFMDLYLPVPPGKQAEAMVVVQAYQNAVKGGAAPATGP